MHFARIETFIESRDIARVREHRVLILISREKLARNVFFNKRAKAILDRAEVCIGYLHAGKLLDKTSRRGAD